MTALSIRGLAKRFRGEVALEDVSLDIPSGRTLALFGPSGAGKTVLLRCIAGAVEPDAGSVLVGSEDMVDTPPEQRGVGMAFQNFALFPHMSAFENIASPLAARRSTSGRIGSAVADIARLLKIDHVLSHLPRALSNGQKQRTALARALVAQPRILLLDDPLRNVDAKLRFEMRLELPRLLADQGATVIYVTQDYKEAMALGDSIAVMSEGRIAQIGTPEEIYLTPASIKIAKLFGDPTINLLDIAPRDDGESLCFELSGRKVRLDSDYAHTAHCDCVLGLRPESLRFSTAPNAIPVVVEAETPLNEKVVSLVTTDKGREILVSRPVGSEAPASGKAGIAFDTAHALFFDRTTGMRLAPTNEAMQ